MAASASWPDIPHGDTPRGPCQQHISYSNTHTNTFIYALQQRIYESPMDSGKDGTNSTMQTLKHLTENILFRTTIHQNIMHKKIKDPNYLVP